MGSRKARNRNAESPWRAWRQFKLNGYEVDDSQLCERHPELEEFVCSLTPDTSIDLKVKTNGAETVDLRSLWEPENQSISKKKYRSGSLKPIIAL